MADAAAAVTGNPASNNVRPTQRQGARFWKGVAPATHGSNPLWSTVTVLEQKPGNPPRQTYSTGHVFFPPVTENYGHDDDGNLTKDGRWNYGWDAENRLVKMETCWQGDLGEAVLPGLPIERIEYGYDAFGRWAWKRVSVKTGVIGM